MTEFIYFTIDGRPFSIRKDILVSTQGDNKRCEVVCTFAPVEKNSEPFSVTYYLESPQQVISFISNIQ